MCAAAAPHALAWMAADAPCLAPPTHPPPPSTHCHHLTAPTCNTHPPTQTPPKRPPKRPPTSPTPTHPRHRLCRAPISVPRALRVRGSGAAELLGVSACVVAKAAERVRAPGGYCLVVTYHSTSTNYLLLTGASTGPPPPSAAPCTSGASRTGRTPRFMCPCSSTCATR